MVDTEKPSPAPASATAPALKKKAANVKLPSQLNKAARMEGPEVFGLLETAPEGLTKEEACKRLEQFGPNEVSREQRHDWLVRFWHAVRNPLVILLTILAGITFYTARNPAIGPAVDHGRRW